MLKLGKPCVTSHQVSTWAHSKLFGVYDKFNRGIAFVNTVSVSKLSNGVARIN
jgi:hypothetical protein